MDDALPSAPARVLVVEDDEALRGLVAELLSAQGHAVDSAPDGTTALTLLDHPGPPVGAVLLDLRLPDMDGGEFASRARARPGPPPHLIVFTAASPVEAAGAAESLRATGFVTKPFDADTLLEVVQRSLAAPPLRPAPAPAPPGPVPASACAPPVPGKIAVAQVVRRRQLVRLQADVARIRASLPEIQAELRSLAVLEGVRRLTPAEAGRVTALRRQSEALRLELGLFRQEFERLRVGQG